MPRIACHERHRSPASVVESPLSALCAASKGPKVGDSIGDEPAALARPASVESPLSALCAA